MTAVKRLAGHHDLTPILYVSKRSGKCHHVDQSWRRTSVTAVKRLAGREAHFTMPPSLISALHFFFIFPYKRESSYKKKKKKKYIYIYIYIYIHICYIYARMYVCMYVCVLKKKGSIIIKKRGVILITISFVQKKIYINVKKKKKKK